MYEWRPCGRCVQSSERSDRDGNVMGMVWVMETEMEMEKTVMEEAELEERAIGGSGSPLLG